MSNFIKIKHKIYRKLALLVLMFTFLLLAVYCKGQNCNPSDLYGWATENGGTTGGAGGSEVTVTTMAQLNTEAAKSGSLIIYIEGTLTGQAKIKSDKTVFGLPGAKIQGSIRIDNAHNVIVKNLIVRGDPCSTYDECKSGADAVKITGGSTNIWLDHMDIADGQDGNCDVNEASDFITISWCKFSYTYDKQHRFSNLVGSDDDVTADIGKLNITYHHNWWADRIVERQPRVRYGKIHVANNLYTSAVSNYLVGPGQYSDVIVEANVMTTNATPVKVYTGYTAVLGRDNVGPKAATANSWSVGTAFVPPYSMPIDPTTNLQTDLMQCAGATLSDPHLTGVIEDQTLVGKVLVSPQPFSHELKIEVPSGCTYKIYDLQGHVIFEENESNHKVFETSGLPEGIYLLSLIKDGKVKNIRLHKIY